jgi:hypothetical protein
MQTYDLLVKVPVVAAPTFDGTRDVSIEFQHAIDRLIDELLDTLSLSRLRLPATDRTVWISQVLNALSLPPQPPQMDLFGQ